MKPETTSPNFTELIESVRRLAEELTELERALAAITSPQVAAGDLSESHE